MKMDRKICMGIFILAIGLCASGSDQKRICERKCEEYTSGPQVTKYEVSPIPELAKQSDYRHVAAFGWSNASGNYTFRCAGSLISPRFVLTTAKCAQSPSQEDPPAIVRLGDRNLDPSVQDDAVPIDVPIKSTHRHPDFRGPKLYNDIALIELASDVQPSSNVHPACLWTHSDFADYSKAYLTGWDLGYKTSNLELEQITHSLFENTHCDELFKDVNIRWEGFMPTQMCAREQNGNGTYSCRTDSGAPLQVTSKDKRMVYVMGVSSGRLCGRAGAGGDIPTIFTRVSAYLDWIEKIVWPEE